jgi:sugar/nucleoside kinase (ribokinase family)
MESLLKSKVDISLVKIDETIGTGATVVLNVNEDRANTTYQGAMNYLTLSDVSEDDLKKARHLHFSSYFMQPGMWGDLGNLFRTAKKLGLTTSFDMQWDPAETWNLEVSDVLPFVDVFLPNENELTLLMGKDNPEDALSAIKKYINVLVIKRGNKGSQVFHNDILVDLPPYLNKNVVDAIGAGDSFNAGFIIKFIKGAALIDCQKFGNLTGAVSTTASGGTSAFKDFANFRKVAKQEFGVHVDNS